MLHQIVKSKVKPSDLGHLYGAGGDKYVAGGLVLRRVKDWSLAGETIGEGALANKVASHELNALDFVRGKLPELEVPLACIIDFFGVRYLAESLVPITPSSLVYGSNTDGIKIEHPSTVQAEGKTPSNAHLEAAELASKLAQILN